MKRVAASSGVPEDSACEMVGRSPTGFRMRITRAGVPENPRCVYIPPPLPIRKNPNVFACPPRKSLHTQHLQTFWSIPVSACGHRTYCAIFLLTSGADIDYTLRMITDRAVLLAVRRAPCGHTSVESFIAAHGVTRVRPSLRGMRRASVVRVRPTRVVRSRG